MSDEVKAPEFPPPKYPTATPHSELRQFFTYAHLPANLQEISKPFGDMAEWILNSLPYNSQRDEALNLLLKAKDCAVRAKLHKNG